ncbi:MAG: NAD(P)H-dependent oxidoreductase subunit E, partial [Rhodospirillales bacterium]
MSPTAAFARRTKGTPKGRQVAAVDREALADLLSGRGRDADLLIEHLHVLNDADGRMTHGRLAALAEWMGLSLAEVFEVATFYHHFRVVADDAPPDRRPVLRVCDGIACRMAGAADLFEESKSRLGEGARVERGPCMG